MKIGAKLIPIFILILLVPLVSYGQQQVASLEIDLTSVSGERVDSHGMALKIYQGNTMTPFKIIKSLPANPYKISLPQGYMYKIEAYASSMFATVGYVNLLDDNNEKIGLTIPDPGSVLLEAYYNDGATPINNATVMIKSNDGTYSYWTNSTTDEKGNTIRFWLQPTILNDNYYVATVSIGNYMSYSYYPVSVLPDQARYIKITTPWPAEEPPISASVYKSALQKISQSDGNFVVQLYDSNENKIAESKVNKIGDAYFSNLKVGSYTFRAVDLNDNKNGTWGEAKMIIDGNQTPVQIFKNQIGIPIWIKNNAAWWASSQISDDEFVKGIQYLITEKIVQIPPSTPTNDIAQQKIPIWIKNTAAWWSDGDISDGEFVKGIQWLVSNGIIKA